MIHDSTSSSPMRMNIAMNRPMRRAFSCCSFGSLSTRIEMKTMLSMPSTSSSAVSVARAIQACGSVRSSSIGLKVATEREVYGVTAEPAAMQSARKHNSSAATKRSRSAVEMKLASKLLRASAYACRAPSAGSAAKVSMKF